MNAREICDRYEKLYTGAVADILDEKGYRRQCLERSSVPFFRSSARPGLPFRPWVRRPRM